MCVTKAFSICCLKDARKGSRSDLKNRIFRPITRRWGICFRYTQRYTVCGLTPRNLAASFTVRGCSISAIATFEESAENSDWFIGWHLKLLVFLAYEGPRATSSFLLSFAKIPSALKIVH